MGENYNTLVSMRDTVADPVYWRLQGNTLYSSHLGGRGSIIEACRHRLLFEAGMLNMEEKQSM